MLSVPIHCFPSQPAPYYSAVYEGVSSILTLRICGPSSTDAEPVEVQPVCDHILLGLEQHDVHLGCKQTAQDHEAA